MTVQTPKFIISECERLIEALPHQHKHKAEKIIEQLHKLNRTEEAIRVVEYMEKLEEAYVSPYMTPQLFKRSRVSKRLITALEQYEDKEEAKDMLDAIQDMAKFKSSWSQDDEGYMWDRTFDVVKSPTEWRRICARAEVLTSKGGIQIALQIKKPKKLKVAEKAWKDVSRKLNMQEDCAKLHYEIWFRQKDRAYYYIYLP